MPKCERIGISMREVGAQGYDETRDALARDWGRFMAAAMPEAAWLPIPNLGAEAVSVFCRRWGLQGLILSGGEDLGASPLRDETEQALLAHFSACRLPVLGVCRGLQLMWTRHGGHIRRVAGHAGVTHGLAYLPHPPVGICAMPRTVRSYHTHALADTGAGGPFEVMARAQEDGSIEGVRAIDGRMLGVMWHIEREWPIHPADRAMVRGLFGWSGEAAA